MYILSLDVLSYIESVESTEPAILQDRRRSIIDLSKTAHVIKGKTERW